MLLSQAFSPAVILTFSSVIPSLWRTYSTGIPVTAANHFAQSVGAAFAGVILGPSVGRGFRLSMGRLCSHGMGSTVRRWSCRFAPLPCDAGAFAGCVAARLAIADAGYLR